MTYDAVIIGAGPARLSAALAFGRPRRMTLLIDGGPGRNAPSDGVHNFLSRDGSLPLPGAQVSPRPKAPSRPSSSTRNSSSPQPQPTDHH
jgi:thioredoxin reductase